MKYWQQTALFLSSIVLTLVLSVASVSLQQHSNQITHDFDQQTKVQAHILTSEVHTSIAMVPETLSESFEPLEPRKRAKTQAHFSLLKELAPVVFGATQPLHPRYFMAPSRAPPLDLLA